MSSLRFTLCPSVSPKVWRDRRIEESVPGTLTLTSPKAAGYADLGTLYTSAPFSHTPTCMRPVHFEASLWIALVRNMSMRPRNNGPLRIRPTQLGIEQQGRLPLHPASLPRTLRRFAFALWPQH